MAQFRKDTQTYLNDSKTVFEVGMLASSNGSIVSNSTPFAISNRDDFTLSVARGVIPNIQGLSISGYQNTVDGTWIPLWDGGAIAYTYLNTSQQLTVWSSSDFDTSVSITINGLDSDYNMQSETIILTNGTTGVVTTKSFLRVNGITSATNPVGDIHVGNSGKTIVLSVIPAGNSKSSATIYTVPNGYTFYLTQSIAYTNQNGNQYSLYRSYTTNPAGVVTTILTFPLTTHYESRKVVPRPYPAKTDIQWQFTSSATSQIGAQIEGYLVQGS